MFINNMLQSLAMAAGPSQAQGGQQPNALLAMFPILLMAAVFYFLVLRPQNKRQVEHRQMISSLKKGDKVITSGGILGTVVGVKEKTVVLKVGEGDTKLEFLKTAISIINDKDIGNS
ncbi:MAG: preprotein translocase subunit YajC [Candidatus Omnitrophica bacterium]|nr:preprotein translocase subunit YajC [Candidatus Omnitrophota bacterium]